LPGNGFGVTIKNIGGAQVFYARVTAVGYLLHSPAPSPLAPGGGIKAEVPAVTVLSTPVKEVELNTGFAPANYATGLVGDFYGSRMGPLAGELAGGEFTFNFYGNTNAYPGLRKAADPLVLQTDELVVIRLPTHSVVTKWGAAPARSAVQMKLFDAGGALVWELYDTKSGYHPNAFGTGGQAKRGNNHPDDGARWIKKGKYRLWYKNISAESQLVQEFWWGTARVGAGRIVEKIKPGQEAWFDLDMSVLNDKADSWKLNCNYY
jgi:hypothetical protein